MVRVALAISVAIGMDCVAAFAQGQLPFIIGLGDLPGGRECSYACDVSRDGAVVVGSSVARGILGFEAYRWTAETGMVPLRPLETATGQASAIGVSADGTVIVGTKPRDDNPDRQEVFRWAPDTGTVGLGDIIGVDEDGFVNGLSADGTTVIGQFAGPGFADGFRWSDANELTWLGSLPGGNPRSKPIALTADGSVIVGAAVTQFSWRAFRWTAQTGMQMIGPLEGPIVAQFGIGVSADGMTVMGLAVTPRRADVYLWSEASGFELLGFRVPGARLVGPDDMTPDARIIVGQMSPGARTSGAFIWDRAHGARDFQQVLIDDYGLDMSGWFLTAARAISPDGRYIVGEGGAPGQPFSQAWLAFLGDPVPCPGDADGDRQVNISDIGALLAHFGTTAGATVADGDTDSDGDVDVADLQAMLELFGNVCPL